MEFSTDFAILHRRAELGLILLHDHIEYIAKELNLDVYISKDHLIVNNKKISICKFFETYTMPSTKTMEPQIDKLKNSNITIKNLFRINFVHGDYLKILYVINDEFIIVYTIKDGFYIPRHTEYYFLFENLQKEIFNTYCADAFSEKIMTHEQCSGYDVFNIREGSILL